ncbi:MAG: glycosyltransferase family 2 protein [Candidatus Latescibacterota bacterium]|nr:MAG: glycosyltransferase family 2 protein [Candidatus Latescibacterota bacterium]
MFDSFPMPLAILIPAYNAAVSLPGVLGGVFRFVPPQDVLVVDDGSSDGTREAAERAGVHVVTHPINRGKGAALKTGFSWALDRGYEAVIALDADGQHDPESVPDFVRKWKESGADLVVGSRMANRHGMPLARVCSNAMTSWVISRRAGQRIEDSQSGYRLIAAEVLRRVSLETDGYEMESELLIKAARSGFQIVSVPIRTVYADETSFIHPLRDTGRFIALVWRSLSWA